MEGVWSTLPATHNRMGLELGALSEAAAFFATVPEDEVVADPLLDGVSETLQKLTLGPITLNIPLRTTRRSQLLLLC